MFDIREYLHPVGFQVPQAKSRYKVGIEPESLLAPFHSYYFLTIIFFTLMIFLVPRGPLLVHHISTLLLQMIIKMFVFLKNTKKK